MRRYLTDYSVQHAEDDGRPLARSWASHLISKYNDGYVKDEKGRPREGLPRGVAGKGDVVAAQPVQVGQLGRQDRAEGLAGLVRPFGIDKNIPQLTALVFFDDLEVGFPRRVGIRSFQPRKVTFASRLFDVLVNAAADDKHEKRDVVPLANPRVFGAPQLKPRALSIAATVVYGGKT